ncbi:MAG: alkaline phosphatase family protein [Thermodesulfobacteriota bacterium]
MHPTVLIGLDGATFSVLEPLMAAGHMPNLQRMVEQGVSAPLLSTANPLTPPAWTSIVTGRGPGNHGIHDFVRWEERPGTFYFTLYNASDILCETVWSMASRQGRTVTHLNFPMMAPPRPVNGFVIPAMVQWRHMRKNVHPGSLVEMLKAIPGFRPEEWGLTYCEANEAMRLRAQHPKEEKEWVERNISRDHQWFLILAWLMERHPSDLTAIVFDGVDKLQHLCWYLLDPDHLPDQLEEWEARMRGYLLDYFRGIDGYLGRVRDLAGEQANIFIVSDHGFGPTRYVFHVNTLLEKLGYLAWLDKDDRKGRDTNHEWSFANLDWRKTTAYVGTPSSNGVCLRAAGEPGERRLAGEEYHRLREKVRNDLLAFRDPVTGEQIVSRVLYREEAVPGPAMDKAPDLFLTLSDCSFVSVVREEPIVLHRPKINGTHRPQGVFIGHGPGLNRGVRLSPRSLLDITPTLLYSLGLPVPEDMEGRVMEGAFSEDQLAARPICGTGATSATATASADPYSKEEEETIFSQLRALGYME